MARGIDDEEKTEEEEKEEEEKKKREEEEEVLTLTTFPALFFARDLNLASVVNADAYDA